MASKHINKNNPGHQAALEESLSLDLKKWTAKLEEATESESFLQKVMDTLGKKYSRFWDQQIKSNPFLIGSKINNGKSAAMLTDPYSHFQQEFGTEHS